ncbi:MAG: NFACT family protein [Nanoarchaeota archaeon]|nr:NFACT family protein [Nanoarchaeota archaeon]
MKKEFSAIEVRYLVDELKCIEDSKIDKIYQPENDIIILQIHKTGAGKRLLRIQGKFMYFTEHKPENPQNPYGFCTYLRKKLSNAILKNISQLGSERIIQIQLETKESKFNLIIELFGSGNTILVQNDKILSPLNIQAFKDREIKSGQKYLFPNQEHNLFEIGEDEFCALLKNSEQESIVKALALDIRLGGIYSEELCIQSSTDKDKKPKEVSGKKIYSSLRKLLENKPDPRIVMKDNDVIDIVPFSLEGYKSYGQKKAETYNQALDSVITGHQIVKDKEQKQKTVNKELDKIKKSIEMQEKNIFKQKNSAEEDQRKGEFIYERYSEIKDILDELGKASKKYSWKEIKEKLKGHKVIKEINEKEGKVMIDIE